MDETPIHRAGRDLKAEVQYLLAGRFPTTTTILRAPNGELHADADALAQADAGIAGAGCVVSVGSGTVTDVAKDASMRAGGIPFVVVQTAVSVNAFSDDMAVLLRDGVKRTVPSRWPDVLIVDLAVIAGAPADMNRAGFGELCSMFTAPGRLVPRIGARPRRRTTRASSRCSVTGRKGSSTARTGWPPTIRRCWPSSPAG